MTCKKKLTRAEIEHTLRKSGYITSIHDSENGFPNRFRFKWDLLTCFGLGRVYLYSGGLKIPYSDLTPEKWERYTGFQFHSMEVKP